MSAQHPFVSAPQASPRRTAVLTRAQIGRFLAALILPLLLFPVAGHWDWWQGWVFLALNILSSFIGRGLVALKHPDLIQERARFTQGVGVKSWDRKLLPLIVYLPLLAIVIAALDLRFAWLPRLQLWLQMLGLAGMIVGQAFGIWAMLVNRFFSSVVRIQADRGQTVVSTGPYRVIRHPGYASGMLTNFSYPLLLGSAWALIPMAIVLGLTVVRTALEDRTLQAELPGYGEYAARVHFRLLPGIW